MFDILQVKSFYEILAKIPFLLNERSRSYLSEIYFSKEANIYHLEKTKNTVCLAQKYGNKRVEDYPCNALGDSISLSVVKNYIQSYVASELQHKPLTCDLARFLLCLMPEGKTVKDIFFDSLNGVFVTQIQNEFYFYDHALKSWESFIDKSPKKATFITLTEILLMGGSIEEKDRTHTEIVKNDCVVQIGDKDLTLYHVESDPETVIINRRLIKVVRLHSISGEASKTILELPHSSKLKHAPFLRRKVALCLNLPEIANKAYLGGCYVN